MEGSQLRQGGGQPEGLPTICHLAVDLSRREAGWMGCLNDRSLGRPFLLSPALFTAGRGIGAPSRGAGPRGAPRHRESEVHTNAGRGRVTVPPGRAGGDLARTHWEQGTLSWRF